VEGCASIGQEKVIPYLVPAEDVTPGVDSEYATVCRECPAGCGMIARVRDGRAHKLEGNPDHPINTGRLCIRGQSALQGLYHPDRIKQPMARDAHGRLQPIAWDEAERRLDGLLHGAGGGRIGWIGPVETGALDRLIDSYLAAVSPNRVRLRYEPFNYESLREAHRRVFGTPGLPDVRIAAAHTLVSFGADFLETWLSNVQHARDFAQWRDDRAKGKHAGRFVFIGPRQGLTGLNADEWIPVRPGAEPLVARALAALVTPDGGDGGDGEALARQAGIEPAPLRRLAQELAAGGPSLILPTSIGQQGPGSVDADEAVLRLNQFLGNVGKTYLIDRPHALVGAAANSETIALLNQMRSGAISMLFLEGGANPAYHLSAATEAIQRVPTVVSFASHLDETASLASLVLPANTPLESWGEYSPRTGMTGIQQPVVSPVFDTQDLGDILLSSAKRLGHNLGAPDFRTYLQSASGLDPDAWTRAVERGFVAGGDRDGRNANPQSPGPQSAIRNPAGLVLHLYPSLHFYDGRTADRAWTQEIPEPVTRAVWGSWAEIHPDTAKRLGIEADDVLALTTPHGRLEVPALPTEHVHPDVIAIQIGQGHTAGGRWAKGVGVNPLALAGDGFTLNGIPVEVKRTPVKRHVVVLQGSTKLVGEDVARSITLAANAREAEERAKRTKEERQPTLYRYEPEGKRRWAMAIDLNRCIGCNACAAACYAENNVPVVGREECGRGREMAWIRIENYRVDSASARNAAASAAPQPSKQPSTVFLPMLCQQCNNAPCEYVCPVNATVHSAEGLNQQIYNRCVGTRFCSNNCPYKVRRFNWAKPDFPPPLDQQLNPDVIRRGKGVMEKCTFCVQRIRRAEIDAEAAGRPIADGALQTACQQTCPADAIVFGDLKDPNSRVKQLSDEARGYGALAHLNTYPNVTYLARVRAE
jgi:molybdopterin-containing oxidoreductase family iron-sulfur binding subunit